DGAPTESKWNTYEVHVSPPVPGQAVNQAGVEQLPGSCPTCPTGPDNVYFTNSMPTGGDRVPQTFPIKFKGSFPVLGGGTITLVIHDSNCLGQQNCGPDPNSAAVCLEPPPNGPRKMDISGMSPQPSGFVQPYKDDSTGQTWYPQWLLWD